MDVQFKSSDRLQFTENVKIPMPWGGYLAGEIDYKVVAIENAGTIIMGYHN